MTKTKSYDNLYANDVKENGVYIGDVVKGRKGYFCKGCGEEMEAVKGPLRRYFRHIVKDRKIIRKCTYSCEKYRHKLAKEFLQEIKQIKVPPVYKYPPSNRKDLGAYKIRDARTIHAHKVRIERQFYEDESGNIRWRKSNNSNLLKHESKNSLIQPDVAFFDKDDKPILFIECVATHKVDEEKMIKIKRLGIDTVEIIIPKDSPENIRSVFYHSKKTEWIYNYEQATTNNVQFPQLDSETVLSINKFQKQLLRAEESYECRKSRLKNLIRGLEKCLASEQYLKIKQAFGTEIPRVEKNTERIREQLYGLQEEHRKGVQDSFELEEAGIRAEEERLSRAEAEFGKKETELERRYTSKDRELRDAQESYEPECQSEIKRIEEYLFSVQGTTATFGERMGDVKAAEIEHEQFIDESLKRNEENRRKIQLAQIEISERIDNLPAEYTAIEEQIRATNIAEKERIERQFTEDNTAAREGFATYKRLAEREFEERRKSAIAAIKNRDYSGKQSLHKRIEDVVRRVELIEIIVQKRCTNKPFERAKKIFGDKSYKNWVRLR